MKIDNSIKSSGQVTGENRTRGSRESSSSSGASSAAAATTQVALSGGLQRYNEILSQAPIVDNGKVDEIKQAISNGDFQVDPEKVADGLIESVRQMLAAQPSAA